MKIRRLQNWISEQLFGRSLRIAATATLAVTFGSVIADAQTTATFRQGVNGYTGVLDTWIRSTTLTAQNTNANLSIDGGGSALYDASWSQALFRFDNLFGTGPGQIPAGSNILTATFTVQTSAGTDDQSSNNFDVHRLLTGFDAATTFANTFGANGVQFDNAEAVAVRDDQRNPGNVINSIVNFNVLNSLQAWAGQSNDAAANAANFGWALTTNAGTNAWVIGSSDNTTETRRPLLSVTFVPGGGEALTWNAANTTGAWNNVTTNKPWLNIANGNADFANGDTVNFSQNPASPVTVTVDAAGVAALSTNFTHASGSYTLTGGSVGGSFTKSGAGNVTLAATNDFAAASVSAGTISTSANNPFGTLDVLTVSNNATWNATAPTQLSAKALAVGSGGATLNVNGTNSLVISGITSGTELMTKTGTGSVTFAGTSSFTGTLNIDQGSVIVSDPVSANGAQGDFNAKTINVASGARFQFGSATPITGENPDLPADTAINLPTGAVADWYVGEQFGSVNLTGGQLNLVTGGVDVRDTLGSTMTSGTINSPTTTQTFVVFADASNASSLTKNSAGEVLLTNTNISANGAIFINEGTISTDAQVTGTGLIALGTDLTVGTLKLRGAGTQTINKLTALGSAGGVIDVSNPAGNVVWAGIVSGGTLTKAGPGVLTLTGFASNTGPTNLNSGTLIVNATGLSAATTVNAANGTTLVLTDPATTASITGLNLGTSSGSNLQFLINGNTSLTPLSVTGTDAFTTTANSNVILQSSAPLPVGSFPLIGYTGTIGGSGLAGLNLVVSPRITGSLVSTGTQIDVNITSSDTLKWAGNSTSAWDINTTSNWNLVTGGTAANYLENSLSGDFVAFDDSATGSTAITLAADVKPALMAFNNTTKTYSITGAGKITGYGQLTKTGTGIVNLDVQYTSTGAITVNDGTLTINSANTLAGNLIVNNGTLNLTAANTLPNLTVNNGAANLTGVQTVAALNVAGGTVASTAGSTFGTITQSSGIVTLDGTNTIGSAAISGGSAIWTGGNTVGAILLSGGSLETRANDGIGSTGTLTMSNNSLLLATTANQTTGKALTITGGGTIQVADTIDFAIGGATAGTGTLNKTGTGTLRLTGTTSFTGTLNIDAGTVILQDVGGGDLNARNIIVNSGGKFQFGGVAGSTENPDLPGYTFITINSGGIFENNIGENFGGINLRGGAVNLTGGNITLDVEASAPGPTSLESGTITGTGAIRAVGGSRPVEKTTSGTVTLTDTTWNTTGGVSILDGTLSTNNTFNATGDLTLGSGSTTGTVQFTNTAALTLAKPVVLGGQGVVDVTQATTTITLSGIVSGSGNLTKNGIGRLALTGANTFTGNVAVNQGILAVNTTGLASTTTVSVNNGGTLEAPTTGQAVYAGLIVASGGNLLFDVTTVPTLAPHSVTTASGVNLSSGSSISVQSLVPLTVGTIPLIDYNTALGGTGLTGVNVVLPPRTVASLVDNLVDTRIDLSITATDFIKWQGNVSAAWDINTTSNWKQDSDNAVTTYLQPGSAGDRVTFDDSAVGNTNIVLGAAVNPAQVAFNNSTLSYSITGAGSLNGVAGITKDGTGTVTIATNNTNSGATTINAGTLQLGNGGTSGSLGSGNIAINAGSKLEFNRSDDTTLTNVFSGTGEIIHNGNGITTLSSNSSGFTGIVTINAGVFRSANLGGTHNFNPTSIVVNNGGTYEFAGPGDTNLPNSTFINLNAGGIVNWSLGETFGGVNVNGGTLNLTSGVTQNGTSVQLTSGTVNGPGNYGGTAKAIKTTAGTVTFNGAGLNTSGGIDLIAGTISTDAAITNTGTLTFGDATSRGTLQLRTATSGSISKPIAVNAGGGVLDVQQAATTITSTGTLTAQPNATLVKAGAGELQLNGTATYGDNATLQVTAGTLSLNPTAAPTIGTSLSAAVASNATLNLGGTVNPLSNGTTHANVANNGTLAATTAGKRVGSITGTGVTNVTATGATLTATEIQQANLNIGSGNTVTVAANGTKTSIISNGLSIASTPNVPDSDPFTPLNTYNGALDLADNNLLIRGGSGQGASLVSSVRDMVLSGFNPLNGFWDGTGLKSSVAATNPLGNTALAVVLNSDSGFPIFTTGLDIGAATGNTEFASAGMLSADDVIVRYTYFGDANLDGIVDGDDQSLLDTGFAGGGTGWFFGDFNYDGLINGDDQSLLDASFGQPAFLGGAGGNVLAQSSIAAVPEPGTLAAGAVALLGFAGHLLRRRRMQRSS